MMMKGEESKAAIEIISSVKSEEEDRISLLPDCLLVEILSCLPKTKHAIRTGALSKRWQHLWPQLPNLIIKVFRRPSEEFLDDFSQFCSSVERIISQSNHLNKVQLHTNYTKKTKSQIYNCFRYAINHNVQEFDFHLCFYPDFYNGNKFVLPEFFFTSSSFIHLKLSLCTFKQADVVSWENLKSLSISHGYLDEDLIENILSGSPLLETLELKSCCGFERIDITNKSVKNLALIDYSQHMLEINAPCILSLAFTRYLFAQDLVLLNVYSVIKAELDYSKVHYHCEEMHEEMLEGLILSLGHVKEVIIGKRCLKALAGLKAKGFIFPSNLKVLQEIDSN